MAKELEANGMPKSPLDTLYNGVEQDFNSDAATDRATRLAHEMRDASDAASKSTLHFGGSVLPPKTEGDFHRLTAGEMGVLRSRMLCVICSTAGGKCDCWTLCDCGWRYEKGTSCSNPQCKPL